MNTQNVWIKRSEREPSIGDAPFAAGRYLAGEWKWWVVHKDSLPSGDYTHWTRVYVCEPPPRELTQQEADWALAKAVTQNWYKVEGGSGELALLAIYAERREVAKLMASYFCGADWGLATNSPALNSLRARLDEQGAK